MITERVERIIQSPVVISYTAYDVLHHGELGEGAPKPAGLEGLSPGRSTGERIRIITDVLADLRERGLAIVDTPVQPLRDTIRLLHNPHRRLYGWYAIREGQATIHGGFHIAESDDRAVLAAWEGSQLVLEPVPADRLLSTVASLLPESAPIAEAPIVVAPERPEPPTGSEDVWLPSPDGGRPAPARDAVQHKHDRIEELTRGPLDFVMQVGRARKAVRGVEQACAYPLNYYVGAHGALLSVIKDVDEEAGPRLHVLPATPDTFRDELRDLAR